MRAIVTLLRPTYVAQEVRRALGSLPLPVLKTVVMTNYVSKWETAREEVADFRVTLRDWVVDGLPLSPPWFTP